MSAATLYIIDNDYKDGDDDEETLPDYKASSLVRSFKHHISQLNQSRFLLNNQLQLEFISVEEYTIDIQNNNTTTCAILKENCCGCCCCRRRHCGSLD